MSKEFLQGFNQIFVNSLDTDVTHGSDSEGSDQGTGHIFSTSTEKFDNHDSIIRFGTGVVNNVKINEFDNFEIVNF